MGAVMISTRTEKPAVANFSRAADIARTAGEREIDRETAAAFPAGAVFCAAAGFPCARKSPGAGVTPGAQAQRSQGQDQARAGRGARPAGAEFFNEKYLISEGFGGPGDFGTGNENPFSPFTKSRLVPNENLFGPFTKIRLVPS